MGRALEALFVLNRLGRRLIRVNGPAAPQWQAEAMSSTDQADYPPLRARLEQRKAELLSELGENQREVLGAAAEGSAEPGDLKTQAEQQERAAVRDAEATRDHDELVAVRAALARFVDGSYGACVDCGGTIALQRLRAQPAAARCLACQEKAEA